MGVNLINMNIVKYLPNHKTPNGTVLKKVLCKCVCGKQKDFLLMNLKKRPNTSCGCLRKIKISTLHKKHGKSNFAIYKVFKSILQRCNNPKTTNYKNYGGRGISCTWNCFEDFYKDMSEGYKKGLSIDRIDNNGNYCKENCRWVTNKEQCNNKRNNVVFQKETACQAGRRLGGSSMLVISRLRLGWKTKDAFELPLFSKKPNND